MNDDRLTVNGTEWITEIVHHWPSGEAEDRPAAVDVFFHDPRDRDQWVGTPWIPYDDADLSEDGMRRLFRRADERSWRDPDGAYWRVRIFRPGPLGPGGDDDRQPDGIISFHRTESSASEPISKVVAELPPVGLLGHEDLQRLLADAARRGAAATPAAGE